MGDSTDERAWHEQRPVAEECPPTVRMEDRKTGKPGAQSLMQTTGFLSRRVCAGNGEAPGLRGRRGCSQSRGL